MQDKLQNLLAELYRSNLNPNEKKLLECIRILSETTKKSTKNISIDELLISINILPNVKGYEYIKDALICLSKHIHKKIYRHISQKHNVLSENSVERDIRYAISTAYLSFHKPDKLSDIYPFSDRPSNMRFLFALHQYCQKNNITY